MHTQTNVGINMLPNADMYILLNVDIATFGNTGTRDLPNADMYM